MYLHLRSLFLILSCETGVGAQGPGGGRGQAGREPLGGGGEALEFLEPGHQVWWQCRSAVRARRSRSATAIRGISLARGPVNHEMVPTATGQGQRVSFNVIP